MAKLPTVRMHPPALLSPFQHISGAAHPSLLPPGKGCDAADTANGELLGSRDAARAMAGQKVAIPAFVQTAGECYKRGYLRGLANQSGIALTKGISIYSFPWRLDVDYTGATVTYFRSR